MTAARLLASSGWPHVRRFLLLWLLVSIEFAAVFGGADLLTAHRTARLQLFHPAELAIPFVPSMVLAYMSIYLIWLPAPFILRTREQIDGLAIALAKIILIAGIGFVALPAELGFPPVEPGGQRWGLLLTFADRLNLDYNLVPSLHVALFVTTAGIYALGAGPITRALLGLWGLTVAAATVLTHQHHVIDALAGIALGLWGARMYYVRQSSAISGWAGRSSTAVPASKPTE